MALQPHCLANGKNRFGDRLADYLFSPQGFANESALSDWPDRRVDYGENGTSIKSP